MCSAGTGYALARHCHEVGNDGKCACRLQQQRSESTSHRVDQRGTGRTYRLRAHPKSARLAHVKTLGDQETVSHRQRSRYWNIHCFHRSRPRRSRNPHCRPCTYTEVKGMRRDWGIASILIIRDRPAPEMQHIAVHQTTAKENPVRSIVRSVVYKGIKDKSANQQVARTR